MSEVLDQPTATLVLGVLTLLVVAGNLYVAIGNRSDARRNHQSSAVLEIAKRYEAFSLDERRADNELDRAVIVQHFLKYMDALCGDFNHSRRDLLVLKSIESLAGEFIANRIIEQGDFINFLDDQGNGLPGAFHELSVFYSNYKTQIDDSVRRRKAKWFDDNAQSLGRTRNQRSEDGKIGFGSSSRR